VYSWCERPERPPYQCALTRQDAPSAGPYFETGFDFLTPVRDADGGIRVAPTVNRLYLSEQAIREACDALGSPLKAIPREEWRAMIDEKDEMRFRIEQLEADLAEREAEIATLNERPLIDTPALVASLEQHFAKKSGRKPSGDRAA
jgi:hypothetical protein